MQGYLYIPAAIERACGVRPSSEAARAIKEAVLGRRIDTSELDREALEWSLQAAG